MNQSTHGPGEDLFQRLQQQEAANPGRALCAADAPAHQLPDAASIQALLALGARLPPAHRTFPLDATGYPVYPPALKDFFSAASAPGWQVHGYDPPFVGRCLRTPGALEASDLSGLCLLLTWMVRGERFSAGHWGAMLEHGHLQRWLARLARLA